MATLAPRIKVLLIFNLSYVNSFGVYLLLLIAPKSSKNFLCNKNKQK